jgi:indolepyruvate decarboxylase
MMAAVAQRKRQKTMSSSPSQRMKIGDFLLRRLKEAGVRHLFGVPGDYNLEVLQQLQDAGALKWIGTCSELNASYAADGYARLNGLGALLVTNGVGALSAINGVGGSYQRARPSHLHRRIDTSQVHRTRPGHAPHHGRRRI